MNATSRLVLKYIAATCSKPQQSRLQAAHTHSPNSKQCSQELDRAHSEAVAAGRSGQAAPTGVIARASTRARAHAQCCNPAGSLLHCGAGAA